MVQSSLKNRRTSEFKYDNDKEKISGMVVGKIKWVMAEIVPKCVTPAEHKETYFVEISRNF